MSDKAYDLVIVGAGIAGGLIALELGRAGKRVLILEAGPAIQPSREEYMENFYMAAAKTPEAPYPPVPSPEGKLPDPASHNNPRATVLAINNWKNTDASYLTYTDDSLPFTSSYERVGGGTTWHWSATSVRFFPNSFRLKSEYGVGVDWPISYSELSPFYDEANEHIGVAGDREADESLGLPFDTDYPMPPVPFTLVDEAFKAADGVEIEDAPENPLRVTITPQGRNTRPHDGRRVCAGNTNCIPICPIQAKYDATVSINAALATGNVGIRYQTVATKVQVASDTGRVTGIEYVKYETATGDATGSGVAKGTLYVIAAHAIETPKLLLNSRRDSGILTKGVANGSDQVGRNLSDHVMYLTWAQTPAPVWPYRGPVASAGFETGRDGPFRAERAAWRIEIGNEGWNWATGDPYRSVIDFVDGLNSTQTNAANHTAGKRLFGKELYTTFNHNLTRQVRMGFLIEQDPDPNMWVLLHDELTDHLGIPRPLISGYGVSDYSKRGFVSAEAAAKKIWAAMGAKDFTQVLTKAEYEKILKEKEEKGGPGNYIAVTDDRGQDHYYPYYGAGHIMGTYRMGNSCKDSVVNPRQQSWDHDNLFLVGSGVFPTTGTGNPTLTIAALALMAAEGIKRDLQY